MSQAAVSDPQVPTQDIVDVKGIKRKPKAKPNPLQKNKILKTSHNDICSQGMLSEYERDGFRGSMSTTRGPSPSPTSPTRLEEWHLDSSASQSDSRVDILGNELDKNSNVVDSFDGQIEQLDASSSYRYNMRHRRRGLCIVFHNSKFDLETRLPVRIGDNRDWKSVETTFTNLGFDVREFAHKSTDEIRAIVGEVSSMDHSDCDCLAVVVMSHGDDGIVYTRDGPMVIDDLMSPFKGNNCPSLVGKPKLFFIQACRGKKLDDGVEFVDTSNGQVPGGGSHFDEVDEILPLSSLPNEADFVIMYATVAGYACWRKYGSCFIQTLCMMLDKYRNNLDLGRILTRVNNEVAVKFVAAGNKKQMPCYTTTLRKELYFTT